MYVCMYAYINTTLIPTVPDAWRKRKGFWVCMYECKFVYTHAHTYNIKSYCAKFMEEKKGFVGMYVCMYVYAYIHTIHILTVPNSWKKRKGL